MIYNIYFCSKNQSTGALNITNYTEYITNGASFIQKLDESLDVGQLTVRPLNEGPVSDADFDLFDWIEVYEGTRATGTLIASMRVAGDNSRMISKNPVRYEHQLTLVEHTKILERFTISGKTFRQPTDGSSLKTLYDVISDLRNTVPLELGLLLSDSRIFDMPDSSTALYTILNDTVAPEFTFKDLTLREALNQVMGYVDAIPRLFVNSSNNLELGADFVNELKSVIAAESSFIEKGYSQDLEFYATSIESDAINIVNDKDVNESVEIYPARGYWVSGRSDNYIYNFLDSYIPTPKRISQIGKLWVKPTDIEYQQISPVTSIYNSNNKVLYYDTLADFPTTGESLVYYADMSDGEKLYQWVGSYVVSSTTPASSLFPKIRIIEDKATFSSTVGYNGSLYDVFVDKSTDLVYRYDSTLSDFVLVNNFDVDGLLMMDVADRVFEKNIYYAQDVDATTSLPRRNPSNFYQSNTFYYDYREQNIKFGATSGIFDVTTSLELVIYIKIFEALQEDGFISSSATFDEFNVVGALDEREVLYQVWYVPIPNSMRLTIDREDLSDVSYNASIISNQQGRIVNLENFANNLHGRINRIGNSELQLEHRVTSTSDLYVVGDYTNDGFIVTEREIILYKDYIYAKYSLSKNYNMISKFIGVNSEIRQYEIAEQNTLERKLLYSEYVEIEATGSTANGSSDSKLFTPDGIACFLETMKPSSTYQSVGGGMMRALTGSTFTDYFTLAISSNGGGNTLIFDYQLPSNRYVAESLLANSSQRAREFEPYTDEYGEVDSISITMYDKLDTNLYSPSGLLSLGDQHPVIDDNYIVTKYFENASGYDFVVLKDGAEEIGGTIGFKLVSDPSTVVIGRKLSSRNRLVNNDPPSSIKLYASTTRTLGRYENFKLDTTGFTELTSPTITVDTTNKYIDVSHASLTSSTTSWVLTDEDGYVLIGVNQDGVLTNRLTFDFKNKRSGIKYKY